MILGLFKFIKQAIAASSELKRFGIEGDIDDQVSEALNLIKAQNDAIQKHNELMESGEISPFVTYFVPYVFQSTKYMNGGPVMQHWTNTIISVKGGIKTWERLQEVEKFIADRRAKDGEPAAKVVVIGLHEIDKTWTPQQAQQVAT